MLGLDVWKLLLTRFFYCRYLNHIADPNIQFNTDMFWFGCNCVNVMKACMEVAPDSMQDVMYSLLKAMNRVAKEHNQHPQGGLLNCKSPPREVPTDAEYSTGTWFMYHALNSEWTNNFGVVFGPL